MKREIQLLAENTFDVLIVGSGIYGAFLAREAAMRGLSVALIEQGDFGSATSANSQKIVHGGLRYLQQLNLVRMRESIRARRQLLTIAPYLVRPQRFLVPTYGFGMQGKWIMRAALLLNDIVSFDRNRGVDTGHRIPAGRVISRRQCMAILPCIDQDRLTGAAQWHDGFIEDTERLMLAIIHSAVQQGVIAANYVTAERYTMDGNRVTGVDARDRLDGETINVRARMVINAAGPGAATLEADLVRQPSDTPQAWVKAFNIFLKRSLFDDMAIGLSSTTRHIDRDAVINRGKRFYFFVPWKGGTLIGTDYVAANPGDDPTNISRTELDAVIEEINMLYPCAGIASKDIGFCHVGLLPANSADPSTDAASRLLKHTRVVDHEATSSIQGLFTVTGIKYTVAPQVVIGVIDRVLARLDVRAPRPDVEPVLYGAEKEEAGTEGAYDPRLYSRYGYHSRDVMEIANSDSEFRGLVGADRDTIIAEVIYAIREEMAVTLPDVVYRRTSLGSTGIPVHETLKRCANIMATELGWSKTHVSKEIISVESASAYCHGQVISGIYMKGDGHK